MSLQNRFYYPFDIRNNKNDENAERKGIKNIPISRLVIIKHQNKTIFF